MAEISIKERKKDQGTSIFAIRTTIGQEKLVASAIRLRVRNTGVDIKAILVPQVLKGYLFVEAQEAATVTQAIQGLRHVRGYNVVGKVDITEIEHFLIPAPPTQGLNVNDVVEIISGPFKGEKAKITRIDESKDEVILELFESPYPIPIRVHADFIKLIHSSLEKLEEKERKEAEEAEKEEGTLEEEEEEEEETFFKL
jgi:transcriptional antiterminator NusG